MSEANEWYEVIEHKNYLYVIRERLDEIDPRYYRPAEVDLLIGDYSKARKKLGWEPRTRFADLVRLMVDADIQKLKDHREGRIRMKD